MKKILSIALVIIAVLTCVSCGSVNTTVDDTSANTSNSSEQVYYVGICQLVQHVSLDSATEGFKVALIDELGDCVIFDEQNASGDSANCTTIIDGFVASSYDLILANATAALTAATAATDTIPVLGTSITSYPVALEVDSEDDLQSNVSGTSDLAPLDEQAAMIKEWMPDAEKVGILYCTAEPNSVYQVEVITDELEALGYEVKAFSFTDSNDVTSVTESACEYADVLYIPTDNTAASNTEAIANIVIPLGIPVFAGEEGICSGCGVATLSISYYDLGYTTGVMAAQILTGEANIENMDIEYAPVTKRYNAENCEALGLTVPDGYEPLEID